MKVLLKNQTVERKNSDSCIVREYNMGDKDLDFAVVTIKGRYPKDHRVMNTQCKEIVYIREGHGKVEVNGTEYSLNPRDGVLIEAGEKFYWEGYMTLLISCHPAFMIEQHQAVA